jgi:hypothetical protein
MGVKISHSLGIFQVNESVGFLLGEGGAAGG